MAKVKNPLSDLTGRLRTASGDISAMTWVMLDFLCKCETSVWYKFEDIASVKENREMIKNICGSLQGHGELRWKFKELSFNGDTFDDCTAFRVIDINNPQNPKNIEK